MPYSFQLCRSAGAKAHERLVVEQPLADFMGLDEFARVYRLADILGAQPELLLARFDPLHQVGQKGCLERIVVELLKSFGSALLRFCGGGRLNGECHERTPGAVHNRLFGNAWRQV